jgi:hypothetical protein
MRESVGGKTMNRVIPIFGQPPGLDQRIDDQQIDPEFKGDGLHTASRAQRDSKAGSRLRIEPDQQAILALERVSGAHVHRAHGLIQAYTNACYLGEAEVAEATKRDMTALAVTCIRESMARDAA